MLIREKKKQLMAHIVEREDIKCEIQAICMELKGVIGEHPLIADAASGKGGFNPMALMSKLGSLGELKTQIPQVKKLLSLLGEYAVIVENHLALITTITIELMEREQ